MKNINIDPPKALKKSHELIAHGDIRNDEYYWMKLSDAQKDAVEKDDQTLDVINYLQAENTYTKAMLQHTEDFQETLFNEIIGRIKQTDMSVPFKYNGYYYITRYEEGKEYPIHSRKKSSLDSEEEIMLEVNEMAKDYEYYAIGGRSVSPNNKILAYGEDKVSRRIYDLKFKNLETGEHLEDVILNTSGSAVWANDNKTIFYTRKDEALRSYKIYRHELGTNPEHDIEIYHEEDETFSTFIYKTKSQKFLVIGSYATVSQEYRILNADTPTGEFEIFQERQRDHEYGIAHFEDRWYIKTNHEAKNFRLMVTSEKETNMENWKEVIPHRPEILLENLDIFENFLVLSERINGITKLRVIPWDERPEHYITFPEEACMAYTSTNPEFNSDILRIGYTSMKTPNSTYDYNMNTQEKTLLKQQEVIGDFNADDYVSERLNAAAPDGVEVPISLVYKKGTRLDGSSPLLLYAYGSYGHSMDPYFSSVRLSLLDRGFVYAIAHIRGGEEMGRNWYDDGKLLNKKNTFTDFIACGQFLTERKYCSVDKLFAMGGSAGGLLMGAIINMAPKMWRGVVAAVPFVDVVTTMLDDTIPLTTGEYDEWGNPNIEEYYHYIKSYSPYDNVVAQEYPNMLVTTGYHDSQVQYWEPAKWVAKLRDVKTDDNILLLHTNMGAGHGGASGRFKRFRETAMEYAFLIDLAGIKLE
ncbi:S9 family peptidase [Portibacter lacus]|uniref:Proline-specific endopeptidase n=1 Tax=Portibacter lacus TaxID=1099794 RepID=A0AA37SLG6_9BACT|nr:S9 family peptidase [Portibacter lacus]GLR16396.1 oligopeptidase B [Portibacter lacus]